MNRNNSDKYTAADEVVAMLEGYATANTALEPALTQRAVWRFRAVIVRLAKGFGILNQMSDEALDGIASGNVDAAAAYVKAREGCHKTAADPGVVDQEWSGAAPKREGDLFEWLHVIESGRPVDSGQRTAFGHRLVQRPRDKELSIEFPYNSGRLIGAEIYDRLLEDRRKTNAPVLLATLKRWKEMADAAGWPKDSDLYRETENAVASAEGL